MRVPLKRRAALVTSCADAGDLPLITLDVVDSGRGRLTTDELPITPMPAAGVALVRPGDVLYGKLRPYLAKSMLVTTPAYASTELLALRPTEDLDSRFLSYVVRSLPFIEWTVATSEGTKMPRTSWEKAGSFTVDDLPIQRQRAIADFLDTETSRVDALIAKKRQLVEVLDERANSRILELIGRSGLVGASAFPTAPIRRMLRKLERWVFDGEMVTAFRDGEVTTRAARGREGFTNAWTDGSRLQRIEAGDVVIHGLDGFSGAIGDAQLDGVCSPAYHVCTPIEGDAAFYGRLLRLLALDGYLGNFAVSTRERAVDFRNWDLFGRIPIPVVPLDLQEEIANQIRAVRPLREKVRQTEVLAQEHRQALITAAVTGELEVPGAAA